MNDKKLVLIDTGMFCEGMRVKANIYYHTKDTYVLFCTDEIFTRDLIQRLNDISNEAGGVYVAEEDYEEVWNESLRRYSLDADVYTESYQKVRQEFDYVLSKTTRFLNNVMSGNTISIQESEEIVNNLSGDLSHLDEAMVLRYINMIGEADNYLYTHCMNVASLNGLIGKWMKMSEQEIKLLIKIGLLHDVGKLKIPTGILNKPGRLTPEEFDIIKLHSVYSHAMLVESGETDQDLLSAVRQHHEKPNGMGYPDGLTYNQISLYARITSVSDVYDAMVSKRCYKEACSPFEILAQFKENRFSDLDLSVVNLFLNNITYLFVGMKCKLSNGEIGEIIFVPPTDFAYPVVKVGNKVITTNDECKCFPLDDIF